jgi:hypothetical protein
MTLKVNINSDERRFPTRSSAVKASYDALSDETQKQYAAINKTGLKIEPVPLKTPTQLAPIGRKRCRGK